MPVFTWGELEAGWRFLTKLMQSFEPSGGGFATLVEARRLTEIEMREQGFSAVVDDLVNE